MEQREAFWTAARLTALCQYWADGALVFDIAQELGCSRSAVIGKAHRLKLGPAKRNEKRISWRISQSQRLRRRLSRAKSSDVSCETNGHAA